MADAAGFSPLDQVRQMLGIQTDAESQMLARRTAEAVRTGDAAAIAQGRTPPAPKPAPVTTPIKAMDRTTAGVMQQRQETLDSVMQDYQNLYGPRSQPQLSNAVK